MRQRVIPLLAIYLFANLALSLDPLSQLRQALKKEQATEWMGRQHYAIAAEKGFLHLEAIVKNGRSNKVRLEFLSPPSFAGYVMVWKEESGFIMPAKGKGMPLPYLAPAEDMRDINLELLSQSAKVSLKGEEKILGRTAQIFLIEPAYVKGGYLKIWLDKDTGIRLKMERYSPKGKLLSTISLLSLQLNPSLKEEEFTTPNPIAKAKNYSLEELQDILHFRPLLPSYLPRGYAIVRIYPLSVGKQKAAIIHLTDGLNPITIMETPHPLRQPSSPSTYEQETITLRVKGYGVALMGNVDKEVLEKIGLSLK